MKQPKHALKSLIATSRHLVQQVPVLTASKHIAAYFYEHTLHSIWTIFKIHLSQCGALLRVHYHNLSATAASQHRVLTEIRWVHELFRQPMDPRRIISLLHLLNWLCAEPQQHWPWTLLLAWTTEQQRKKMVRRIWENAFLMFVL